MNEQDDFFAANKYAWNKRTMVHKDSEFYDLKGFKAGKNSLNAIEINALGDVNGKRLLHLQCHFGMDTLSWARKGAVVTGVDLSDEAIRIAKETAEELGLDAEFFCSNVYDLLNHSNNSSILPKAGFDILFTSYGTIGWLPDLDKWAALINYFLKPGGVFYIVDFHPALWMMDENFEHIKYHYFNRDVIVEESTGTYANRDADIRSIEYSWNHPLSEIFNALLHHGLQVINFNEYPYSPYNCFRNLEQGSDDMWRIKGMDEKLPMLYSIKAMKQL